MPAAKKKAVRKVASSPATREARSKAPPLRTFRSDDGYRAHVLSVSDPYASADAALLLPAASGSVQLSVERPPASAPQVVAAWPQGGRIVAGWLQPGDFAGWSPEKAQAEGATVVIANPSAPANVTTFVAGLGYSAEIKGQQSGYWFSAGQSIPRTRPPYDPTGAILLSKRPKTASGSLLALDLVQVNFEWVPLSTAATYTYRHSAGIVDGQKWRFVHYGDSGATRVYQVTGIEEVAPGFIAQRFGEQAANRARGDKNSLALRLILEK